MRPLLPLLLLSASLATAAQGPDQTSQAADTIFLHGRILTGEGLAARGTAATSPRFVQALAIRDGRVIAAGSDAQIAQLASKGTRTVDLHGAFAMPGFNDAHTHMAMAGRQALAIDLTGTRSRAAMLARVRRYVQALPADTPPGSWLRGGGWDQTLWPDATLPTRQQLDAVTAGHPALLDRVDGHIALANSAALAAAHLTAGTPDPQGGRYDRTADGQELTGIVREAPALQPLLRQVPPPDTATRRRALEHSIDDALAHGVTSVQDFSDWEDWLVLEEMEHASQLRLRVAEWIDFNLPLAVLEQRRASHPADDPRLHLTQLKAFMDGSLGSRTAALDAPYADDPANSGIPRYSTDRLNGLAAERAAAGFQLGFHAIGDLANTMALDAMAGAEQAGRPPHQTPGAQDSTQEPAPAAFRYRIEHAQVLAPGDFDRYRELGVIASMQPAHLLTDMAWAPARLGPARVHDAYAWHRFLDHGVTLAFGTDYPVESIDPMRGLYAATTRRDVSGDATFDPATAAAEVLTLPEALYAYTEAPAFAEFRERIKGRLVPGQVADLVVLDHDLLALGAPFISRTAARQLLATRVLRTFVGGVEVYTAGVTAPVTPPARQADEP